MPKLQIIVASTRPGRAGKPIGAWFVRQAELHGGFDIEVTDLKELALPLMDEPHHPILRRYSRSHTVSWSKTIESSDSFVFVMPEYKHGFTAPLKNAIANAHPDAMVCAATLQYFIEMGLSAHLTRDETGYLALHVARLVADVRLQTAN